MAAHPLLATVPSSAEWLPHRYDPGHDAVHFIKVDRSFRRSVPFLIDAHLPQAREPVVLRRGDSLAAASPAAPLRFVFHSAFCCSTLLAGSLDREGLATSLNEPTILNDIVGWRRRGAPVSKVAEVLDSALSLLARPFNPGELVIIKPSNVLNSLAPAILRVRPEAKALLLYAPLRVFLTSVAKKGLDGRLWVRELFLGLRTDGLVQRLGFDDQAFFGQTDLQIAACGWLAQQALFADMIAAPSTAAQVRSLDSEALLAHPREALFRLADHYGLTLEERQVADLLEGPFKRNSKSGAAFDANARQEEYRRAGDAHSDEIDKVMRWAEVVAQGAGIPLRLGATLI
jgi:hypothetical protein